MPFISDLSFFLLQNSPTIVYNVCSSRSCCRLIYQIGCDSFDIYRVLTTPGQEQKTTTFSTVIYDPIIKEKVTSIAKNSFLLICYFGKDHPFLNIIYWGSFFAEAYSTLEAEKRAQRDSIGEFCQIINGFNLDGDPVGEENPPNIHESFPKLEKLMTVLEKFNFKAETQDGLRERIKRVARKIAQHPLDSNSRLVIDAIDHILESDEAIDKAGRIFFIKTSFSLYGIYPILQLLHKGFTA